MRFLDPFSLVLMATLMCCVMIPVLYSVHRSFPADIRGSDYWVLALLLQVAAAVAFSQRGLLPDLHVLPAANVLFILGMGMGLVGTEKFYGRPPSWRFVLATCVLALAGMLWWLVVQPNYLARVVLMSILVGVVNVVGAVVIVRHGARHFSTWFFGSLMIVNAFIIGVRGVLALQGRTDLVDLTRPGSFQSAYLALSSFVPVLQSVGFILVATQRLQTILERRSTRDPLTEALNRRGFAEVYDLELARMRRRQRPMTLFSIDLDHFKAINDTYGHAVGDQVLVHAANTVASALRQTDHLARFGGEEFIVLLPDADLPMALTVAERVLTALRAPREDGVPAYTASIGVAPQRNPDMALDVLLDRADQALYRAKNNGRNRIEMYQGTGSQAIQA